VIQSRAARAEQRRQFWNPEEEEHPQLETIIRRLVKTVAEIVNVCNSVL
jgi:hypothetical protein